MPWLRPGPPPHQTALAMIGAKPGQQVLIVGAGDGQLPAAVASVTGLNGRTLVIDPSPSAEARVSAAAAEEGVLVDFEPAAVASFAAPADGFDIAVVHRSLGSPNVPAQVLNATARLLRPGGRVIVIEGGMTGGWRGIGQRPIPPALAGATIRDLLTAAGLRAARILAETDGVIYIEGAKSRG
jgi:ubiquinone/menaquinone biosynthesis C-methylase UbiE